MNLVTSVFDSRLFYFRIKSNIQLVKWINVKI